jgi:hypothetical protein
MTWHFLGSLDGPEPTTILDSRQNSFCICQEDSSSVVVIEIKGYFQYLGFRVYQQGITHAAKSDSASNRVVRKYCFNIIRLPALIKTRPCHLNERLKHFSVELRCKE